VIGASLFASNIGSEIILGVSGAGARADMPTANFEIIASLVLILFGWIFVPFYLRSGVYTMPEFLEKRYNRACRDYLSVVSVLAYIITKISLIIFAGALVFEVLGIPFWTGAIITVIATGFYTVLGGLKAVIYTDMVQAFVLLLGTAAVTIFGLQQIGGWGELITTISDASINNNGPTVDKFFNLWRPMEDTEYPWTGMLFGAPILGVWYWCTDQYIVQRALSAKDVSNARKGALFAGYLKLLPVFIFFIPGVVAYALLQKGLIDLAALMSSLSSAFNSSSTLLTIDFYQKFKPKASEKDLVRFGRMATIILVLLSLGWIPFMESLMGGGIFHYLQSVQAYISPPIAAVFLLGLFFKWINGKGAIVALWTGFALGIFRLVAEFMNNEGTIDVAPTSLLGSPQPVESLELVTFQRNRKTTDDSRSKDAVITVGLLILVLILWWLFSPWGIG